MENTGKLMENPDMEELLARIKAEKWRMTLKYSPTMDIFFCEIFKGNLDAFGKGKTIESAIVAAINEMDKSI